MTRAPRKPAFPTDQAEQHGEVASRIANHIVNSIARGIYGPRINAKQTDGCGFRRYH